MERTKRLLELRELLGGGSRAALGHRVFQALRCVRDGRDSEGAAGALQRVQRAHRQGDVLTEVPRNTEHEGLGLTQELEERAAIFDEALEGGDRFALLGVTLQPRDLLGDVRDDEQRALERRRAPREGRLACDLLDGPVFERVVPSPHLEALRELIQRDFARQDAVDDLRPALAESLLKP